MKKIISVICIAAMLLSMCAMLVNAEGNDTEMVIYAGGKEVIFDEGAGAKMIEDNTMIPLRKASEALGVTVYWISDEDGDFVQVVSNDRVIQFMIEDRYIDVYKFENGKSEFKKSLEMPIDARLIGDYTYVPLRATGDTIYSNWDAIENCDNIQDLAKYEGNENNTMVYYDADKEKDEPAKVVIPEVKTEKAEGLIELNGNLIKKEDGWFLREISEDNKEWKIENFPFEEEEVFWQQQIGVKNPDGIHVKVSFFTDEDGVIKIKRTTTGILPVRNSLNIVNPENASVKIMLEDKEIKNATEVPENATLKVDYGEEKGKWEVKVNEDVLTEDSFKMPESVCTVVISKRLYKIDVPECFEPITESIEEGKEVTLSVKPNYYIDEKSLLKNTHRTDRTFTMPGEDVTIDAVWVTIIEGLPENATVAFDEKTLTITFDNDPNENYELYGYGVMEKEIKDGKVVYTKSNIKGGELKLKKAVK